jgi:Flp pilus assembly protein TadD
VLESNPKNSFLWGKRGWALARHQQYEEAIVSHDRAIELKPNYEDGGDRVIATTCIPITTKWQ